MDFLKKLEHTYSFWFLLITSFAFFLMRLPSFFEPYWYGDEGVYEILGYGIRHGRLLYEGVWDNKPPLLYLIYALFDGNQPYVKFASFIAGLAAVWIFYFLAKRLFERRSSIFVATGIFTLLLGLPFLEGNIANAENFMILPAVASSLLVVKAIQEKKSTILYLALAGFLLGVSFLIKVVAVFDFASFFLIFGFVFFAFNWKAIQKLFAELLTFSVAFFIPLFITIGFFAYKGILKTFIQSAFLSNVGYVNYANQLFIPFTKIAVPQGFLLIKLVILLLVVGIVFWKRKSLSLLQIIIFVWLPFSIFNAFFSGRPWTHYMLVLVGSLALLIGVLLQRRLRILNALFLIIVVGLLATNFWFYGKIIGYYENFAQYELGQKTTNEYQSFFDSGVPRDYAIADFLKKSIKPNQKVFLWTNSAQLYYLIQRLPLGRYTVAYHITASPATLNETAQVLKNNQPDFVVLLPNASSFPFAMVDYRLRVDIDGGLIYEKLF